MTDAAYDPSDDTALNDDGSAATGAGAPSALNLQAPPLWAFDPNGRSGFQPSGDPLRDNLTQALFYHIGLDDPANATPGERITMQSLGLAPKATLSGWPNQYSDDDPSGFGSAGPQVQGGATFDQAGLLRPSANQTGFWSKPSAPSSPGQAGTAEQGARALEDTYDSGHGGTYTVDPATMGMDGAIDAGSQIAQNIAKGGPMKDVFDTARASGKPVDFDTARWGRTGLMAFDHHPWTLDGSTVGRFGGFVRGQMTATPDGAWSASGAVDLKKSHPMDYNLDAGDGKLRNPRNWPGDTAIAFGHWLEELTHGHPWLDTGKSVNLNFNRTYNFRASGNVR